MLNLSWKALNRRILPGCLVSIFEIVFVVFCRKYIKQFLSDALKVSVICSFSEGIRYILSISESFPSFFSAILFKNVSNKQIRQMLSWLIIIYFNRTMHCFYPSRTR